MKSFDPSCFPSLLQIEERHFWFRARNNVIIATLRRWLPASPQCPIRILEIGCGNGNVLRAIERELGEDVVLVGVDLFREALCTAASRVKAELVQADVRALPFTAAFDAVGLFDVLEHLSDEQSVLQSVCSVLKPGGQFFLTVPAYQKLWSYFDVLSCHQRRYGKEELHRKLVRAGFGVEFLGYYMSAILPLVLLRRWATRGTISPTLPTDSLDLKVVPFINELLFWALSAERNLLAPGLPFGTSLLAVAHARKDKND